MKLDFLPTQNRKPESMNEDDINQLDEIMDKLVEALIETNETLNLLEASYAQANITKASFIEARQLLRDRQAQIISEIVEPMAETDHIQAIQQEHRDNPATISRFVRLENKSEGHNKYYEISLKITIDDSTKAKQYKYQIMTSWGPIGSSPRMMEKYNGSSMDTAVSTFNSILGSKKSDGYKTTKRILGEKAFEHFNPGISLYNDTAKSSSKANSGEEGRLGRFSKLDI